MNGWDVLVGAAVGIAATELTEISPWLARKVVRWSARHWSPDPEQRAAYEEEWTSVVDERPGKVLKLFTAAGFAGGAVGRSVPRVAGRLRGRARRGTPTQTALLGFGGLLITAAAVFGAVALTAIPAVARVAILTVAAAALLTAASMIVRHGLSATGETVAAIGLGLFPLTGYVLWTIDGLGLGEAPLPAFVAFMSGMTALVAYMSWVATRLNAARYISVLAAQPVLPLFMFTLIDSPAGWLVAAAAVAAIDIRLLRWHKAARARRMLPARSLGR